MEIRLPIAPQAARVHAAAEFERAIAKVKSTPVSGDEYFSQLGDMGKILKEVMEGEGRKRVKAFENPEMVKFMHSFYDFVDKRAKEMGLRFDEVTISNDSSMTPSGIIFIRVDKKTGKTKGDL